MNGGWISAVTCYGRSEWNERMVQIRPSSNKSKICNYLNRACRSWPFSTAAAGIPDR